MRRIHGVKNIKEGFSRKNMKHQREYKSKSKQEMALVVNKRNHTPTSNDVYIGRPSKWGNPFVIGKDGDRKSVIQKYEEYLIEEIKTNRISLKDLASLHGKTLVCFCKPHPCHGDILTKAAQWAAEK